MTSWRQKTSAVAAIAALLCPAPGFAQTHKVAATPESVVRAIGVYEWTGDIAKPTGSRFVPVTLFIDGGIEDAGVYKPQPVPFALLTGNVYELEDAGLGKGTLVLEQAMRAETPEGAAAPSFIDGWTAYGSYKPPAAPKKAAPLRASKTLPVIQTSGGDSSRPHLTNKSDNSTKTDTSSNTGSKGSSDDDSRPTMKRRTDPPDPPQKVDDDTNPQDPNAASSQSKSDDDDRAERPTLRRRSPDDIAKDQKDKKKAKETASVTASGSMADDPDRPRLKHGTRTQEDEEMPKLMGVPDGMRQMVAVSDAKNRDPHVFARPWEDMAERAAILTKMQAFARAKLAAYGVVPGVDPPKQVAAVAASSSAEGPGAPKLKRGIPTDDTASVAPVSAATATKTTAAAGSNDPAPPKLKRGVPTDDTTMTAPAASTAKTTASSAQTQAKTAASSKTASHTTASARSKHVAAKTQPQIELADEELKGYLLSYGGAPTYVYMAHTVEQGAVTRYVTVIAQADATGQLKVALASATDAAHLDRTPWMRLVDVVDVEASNRASLLFEMRGRSSRQFALYRVIATKPEQIFSTAM